MNILRTDADARSRYSLRYAVKGYVMADILLYPPYCRLIPIPI